MYFLGTRRKVLNSTVEKVFVLMDSIVKIHYKERGEAKSVLLETGDIFYAGISTEHVAHPQGEARILVIEKVGSV